MKSDLCAEERLELSLQRLGVLKSIWNKFFVVYMKFCVEIYGN